jgi:hypothetical protein
MEHPKGDSFFFYFQQRKFVFFPAGNTFVRLKPQLTGCALRDVITRQVSTELFEDNVLEIPIKPFS